MSLQSGNLSGWVGESCDNRLKSQRDVMLLALKMKEGGQKPRNSET